MINFTRFLPRSLALIALSLTLVMGCSGPSSSKPEISGMNSPQFHLEQGQEALLAENYEAASQAFQRVLVLAPNHALAMSGKAVARASMASKERVSVETKKSTHAEATSLIEQALDKAQSEKEEGKIHLDAVRVEHALKQPANAWFKKARAHYEKAAKLIPNNPALKFFYARALAETHQYDKAAALYSAVMSQGGPLSKTANQELAKIQRIQRSMPSSRYGKQIANIKRISRSNVAALFVAELNLQALYRKKSGSRKGGYQVPKAQRRFDTSPKGKYPEAVDIAGHPLQAAILQLIKLGVKGLEPDPSHRFHPDAKITRAEFALMLEDLLIKATGDQSMATRYIGQDSPFADLSSDHWAYNAARTNVFRGMMKLTNQVTSTFNPKGSVSGADALLSVKNLKDILKSNLR